MAPKVVIIGGSYAAHMALTALYKQTSEVEATVVSMSSHSYFNVSAPRLLVEPEKFADTVFSVEEFVKKRTNGKGAFIHGKATSVDFDLNTVTVSTEKGETKLEYDILVLATGSSTLWSGYKVNESHETAKLAIEEAASKIKTAKLVAIVGGGPTGVETAGEIAYALKSVKVTLYTGSSGPLSATPRLESGAASKLKALGVEVINDVRAKSVEENKIVLENGETKTFDYVFEAFSLTPYSQYLPDSVKDKNGYVVTNKQLVVEGTTNVIALGDIVSGSSKTVVDLKMGQIGVYGATIKRLLGGNASLNKEWSAVHGTILVPISRAGGEGMLFGWHVPNFLVRFLKAKTFFLDKAGEDLL